MPRIALIAALPLLLLAACGGRETIPSGNGSADSAMNASQASAVSDAEPSLGTTNGSADFENSTVSPPDAVSHPDGYLPPPPAEPENGTSNSSGSNDPPPATEDQYTRNGQ